MKRVLATHDGKGRLAVQACSLTLAVLFALSVLVIMHPPDARGLDAGEETSRRQNLVAHGPPEGYFIENRGQAAEGVLYYSTGDPSVAFREDGVMFVLKAPMHRETDRIHASMNPPVRLARQSYGEPVAKSLAYILRFDGANQVTPVGRGPSLFNSNFFLGNDPAAWRRDVPSYAEVVYRDLYDGVDLVYRSASNGVKYQFVVYPGRTPETITMSFEGIESLQVEDAGVVVHTGLKDVQDSAPYSYQDAGPEIECRPVSKGSFSFGFDCEEYDASKPLIIDPLIYSTFLGATGDEGAVSVDVDRLGYAYVAGSTGSPDFPVTSGAFDTVLDGGDAFVAKLNPTGTSLVYATFIGGSGNEGLSSLASDVDGNVYLTGYTTSTDFPVTPGAFDGVYNGTSVIGDVFVAKLNPDGSDLTYSTYLGGVEWDMGESIAVDAAGSAYVTGYTDSSDFPSTPGAFRPDWMRSRDAFVVKLDPSGSALVYATFLGAGDYDHGYAVALDSSGSAFVTGRTYSRDFPVTPGAFDETFNGGDDDVFVAALNRDGSALVYATYLGGSGYECGNSIAVDSNGNAYIGGDTLSTDFPSTPGAFDPDHDGLSYDAYIVKLNATGSDLVYATFIGGSALDYGHSISIDPANNVYITGDTWSVDLPTTPDAFDRTYNGERDAYAIGLNAAGTALVLGTYLGGQGFCDWSIGDGGSGISAGYSGEVVAVGWTCAPDFPVTPGAFDTTFDGMVDGFVVKIGNMTNLSFSTKLVPGRRLMSFPVQPANENIASVLSSIAGCYDYVRWYDPLDSSDHWKSYAPGRAYNDLTRLDNTMGFWINITSTCDFTVLGFASPWTAVSLHRGWNMVGFPSFNTTYTVAALKADIGLAGIIVEAFDANASPYYLRRASDSDAIMTGEGYWIYVPSDATWIVGG